MATRQDIRQLHRHLQTATGGGNLILAVETPTEEQIIADGDYTSYIYKTAQIPGDGLGHLLSTLRNEVRALVDSFTEGREIQQYDIRSVDQDMSPIQFLSTTEIPSRERFSPLFQNVRLDDSTTYQEDLPYFQSYRINVNPTISAMKIFSRRQILETEDQYRMYADENEDEYTKFEQDIVTLPDNFDCIYYDGEIIVINPKNFEKIFDYFEIYRAHADNVLTTLDDSNINVHNFDKFVESIQGDRRALRKMKEIEDIGLYSEITQSDVERVVNEYNLSIEVDSSGQDWEIVIPDMRHKWDIIRLLNDDHLRSELTEDRYQVYGKDRR